MNNFANYRQLYEKYLTTPCIQWDKSIKLPTKQMTSKAIFELGDSFNDDIGAIIVQYLNENKKVWFWSDLHFFHKNICQHANRPFDSMEEMHSNLIKGYYSQVGDDDLVIFGGDIAFGHFSYVNDIITSFPGKKALIVGNHDFHFRTMKPVNYTSFDYINSLAVFEYDINGQTKDIVVTHYPINMQFLPKNCINIHGHTHQHSIGERRINISVENTNYKPKLLQFVLDI